MSFRTVRKLFQHTFVANIVIFSCSIGAKELIRREEDYLTHYVDKEASWRVTHAPSAYCARVIEKLLLQSKTKKNDFVMDNINCIMAKIAGLTAFPLSLILDQFVEFSFLLPRSFSLIQCKILNNDVELSNHRRALVSSIDRLRKYALGVLCTPFSIIAADGVSILYLQRTEYLLRTSADSNADDESKETSIRPFGVEHLYGRAVPLGAVYYPKSVEDIQDIVKLAKQNNRKITIRGGGMSQGVQTVPSDSYEPNQWIVLDLCNLKKVQFRNFNDNTGEDSINGSNVNKYATAEAGATWEDVLLFVNKYGKSILVKQASNIFTVGGSIGVNCHGWQHDKGAISSVVKELQIIDANGELKTLSREQNGEHFRCMFGTCGYFGIIVNATIELTENVMMAEKAVKLDSLDSFHSYYKLAVLNDSLLIGRLSLDPTASHLLKDVYVNTFEPLNRVNANITKLTENTHEKLISSALSYETQRGRTFENVFLDLFSHLPYSLYKHLGKFFWEHEVDAMLHGNRTCFRNDILHFGMKSFYQLHQSDLYTQWLQEYFITPEELPAFLDFLGKTLTANRVRLLNASIRPTPKDELSILPYAEQDRYAIVLCFHQLKVDSAIEETFNWIKEVQAYCLVHGGKWYQAYMPIATSQEFELCYGKETLKKVRAYKQQFDPKNIFSSSHTVKYYDTTSNQQDKTTGLQLVNIVKTAFPPSSSTNCLTPYHRLFRQSPLQHDKISCYNSSYDGKAEFNKFLKTILYQIDESSVNQLIDKALAINNSNKSANDFRNDIYSTLLQHIDTARKPFAMLWNLRALDVLQTGMGKQIAQLMVPYFNMNGFKNYLEIYSKRYVNSIEKYTGMRLENKSALCDFPNNPTSFIDRIEACGIGWSALWHYVLSYPYSTKIALNDVDCIEPEEQVEKTYHYPVDATYVPDNSMDLVTILAGLHHIPKNRLDKFVESLAMKVRPGGVVLLREHAISINNDRAPSIDPISDMADIVHSFVNLSNNIPLDIENREIRNFQSISYWDKLMDKNGLTRFGNCHTNATSRLKQQLILPDDPTRNSLILYVKQPSKKDDVENIAEKYLKKYKRCASGTAATWLEWGNVRSSKQYSQFLIHNPSYKFDFFGHMHQHWQFFKSYLLYSLNQSSVCFVDLVFSDNMQMNVFVFIVNYLSLMVSGILTVPRRLVNYLTGEDTNAVANNQLSAIEKFMANYQSNYSNFVDYEPFYLYPYSKTITDLWELILYRCNNDREMISFAFDVMNGVFNTIPIAIQGLVAFVVNAVSTDTTESVGKNIHVLIDDPQNELDDIVNEFNIWKNGVIFNNKLVYRNCDVEVIYQCDGRKAVSIPFYVAFTEFIKCCCNNKMKMSSTNNANKSSQFQILSIGGQSNITLDTFMSNSAQTVERLQQQREGSTQATKLLYEMPVLLPSSVDDIDNCVSAKYVTYEVKVNDLIDLCCQIQYSKTRKEDLVYIHCHRV